MSRSRIPPVDRVSLRWLHEQPIDQLPRRPVDSVRTIGVLRELVLMRRLLEAPEPLITEARKTVTRSRARKGVQAEAFGGTGSELDARKRISRETTLTPAPAFKQTTPDRERGADWAHGR